MPNRILRDWTDSEAVNSLSWQAECLFIRLIMKADDYGCFHGNPKLLKSLLFPLKDGLRDSDITRWLTELSASGMIRTYTADGGKPFVEIRNYGQRPRDSRRKFPAPPPENDNGSPQVAASRRELPQVAAVFGDEVEDDKKERDKEKTPPVAADLSLASLNLNHPENIRQVITEAEKHCVRISESQAQDFIDANSVTAQGGTWMFRNVPVRDWRKLMNSRWITNWKRDNARETADAPDSGEVDPDEAIRRMQGR